MSLYDINAHRLGPGSAKVIVDMLDLTPLDPVSTAVQGPILAFVYAVKEMIEESRDTGGSLPVNVAFAFEGEEENGSGGFREAIKANLHWFEGTQLIIISNTLWVGEEASTCPCYCCCRMRTEHDL